MLLHSIDNQCVTKQVFYCVAKVEKQNNFLCRKARQRIVFHLVNPNRFIRPQCSKILAIASFPNIFYFLVGILPVFVT